VKQKYCHTASREARALHDGRGFHQPYDGKETCRVKKKEKNKDREREGDKE